MRSFTCPKCTTPSLHIAASIELPPDSRSDEITLQLIRCDACAFDGVALYQESRRGALDDTSFNHDGYELAPESLRRLRALLARCPHPRDPRCTCETHRVLGRQDAGGRWCALEDFAPAHRFPMRFG